MALTTSPAPAPSAGTLHRMRRRFARAHAPGGDRAGAMVTAALGIYVVAGIGWWLMTRSATALADSVQAWNPIWAWVAAAATLAAGAALARSVGPLTTSPECGFWLLSTPVDRAAMLRPSVVVTVVVAAAAGAAGGRIAAFAGAAAQWGPVTIGGAAAGVGVAAIAVLVQSGVLPARTISVLQVLFSAAAIGGALAAAAGLAIPVPTTWAPVAVLAVVTMALATAALRACGRITAADLDAGADVAVAARASIVSLDLSMLAGVVDDRAWRRIATRPTRTLPRGLTRALIRAELLRHLRRPSAVVVTAVIVAGAWLIGAGAPPTAAAWTQLAAIFFAAGAFGTGLRAVSTTPELAGMLGVDDRTLRRPLMVVPACAAAVVAVMTGPLVGWSAPTLMIAVIGACGAAYRTRPRTSYDGLLLETGIGHLPLDLIRQKLRGPDALILAAILLVVAV